MSRIEMASMLLGAALIVSCSDHESPTESRGSGTWTMTSTLSSSEGTDTCVPTPDGGTVRFPQRVVIEGSTIRFLNVVCDDCPIFNGTLAGNAFTASADMSFDSPDCGGHVQGTGVITGTLSPDRTHLTATEVITQTEPSGHEVITRYAWTGASN